MVPAKVKQNSIMLGGNASASYSRFSNSIDIRSITGYETGNRLQAMSRFRAGYFFLNDFVVGLNFNANYTRASTNVTTTTDTPEGPMEETTTEVSRATYLLAGPYARYYLDNGLFGEVTGAAGLRNFQPGREYNLYEATIGVGYAYFLNEKVAIEPMVAFQYFLETNTVRDNYSYGPMFGVGVQVYLWQEQSRVIRYGL